MSFPCVFIGVLYACNSHRGQKRASGYPGMGVTEGCEPLWGYRKWNQGPLKEQPVLMSIESFPQSSSIHTLNTETTSQLCSNMPHIYCVLFHLCDVGFVFYNILVRTIYLFNYAEIKPICLATFLPLSYMPSLSL